MHLHRSTLAVALASVLALGACGDDDGGDTLTCAPGFVACGGACHDASVTVADPLGPDAFEPDDGPLPSNTCLAPLTLPSSDRDTFALFTDGRPLTVRALAQSQGLLLHLTLYSGNTVLAFAEGTAPSVSVAETPLGYTVVDVVGNNDGFSGGAYLLVWDVK